MSCPNTIIVTPAAAIQVVTSGSSTQVVSTTSAPTQVAVTQSITQVITSPVARVQVVAGGNAALAAGATSIRRIFELERVWRISSLTAYRVLGYTGSRLDTVDVWDTSGMGTKFFERVLSYTGANLTETVTTNLITGEVLTATLTYSTGKLATVTKVIT